MTGAAVARHRVSHWTLRADRYTDPQREDLVRPQWNLSGLSDDPETPDAGAGVSGSRCRTFVAAVEEARQAAACGAAAAQRCPATRTAVRLRAAIMLLGVSRAKSSSESCAARAVEQQ